MSRTHPGMDPDTRRLMLFAGGLGMILVGLVGASSLVRHHSSEIPVVTADPRPIREKPLNPGGLKIDGAENDVFSAGSDIADSKLAPAPENPDTVALRTAGEVPQAAAVPTPASIAAAPSMERNTGPAVVERPPAITKKTVEAAPPLPKPVPAKSQVAVAETHAVADAHVAATGHQAVVQLAALTSEEAARTEWQQMTKRMPELLNGRQPNYTRTERDGHTFWRVRTAGFADVSQARAFCEHVHAKGGGCSVADY